jgi:hypothetical protein
MRQAPHRHIHSFRSSFLWRAEKNRETEMPWGDEALRAGVPECRGRTLFAKSRRQSYPFCSKKVRAEVTMRSLAEKRARYYAPFFLSEPKGLNCFSPDGESKDFSMTSQRVRKVPADVVGDSSWKFFILGLLPNNISGNFSILRQ